MKKIRIFLKTFVLVLCGVVVVFAGCKTNTDSVDYDWRECYAVAMIYSNSNMTLYRITDNYTETLGSPEIYYKQIFAKQEDGVFYLKLITWADTERITETECGQKCIIVNFCE